jgi:LacI family transcriptional regulator
MPTIRQVADRAGVSPTTVSHVINHTRFVSEDVRLRVQAAMHEMGYWPNAVARSLRRGETHTLGLMLPDSANSFFAEIARIIEAAAFDAGYSVILCNTEGDCGKEQFYLDVVVKKQVDGVILVATGGCMETLPALSQRVPVVVVDRDLPDLALDAVLADNRQGGYVAVSHLLELGHRRIGCITGPSHLTPSAERVVGYQEALACAGLPADPDLLVRGDFHPESGRLGAHTLFGLAEPPTAIFTCNDLMAIGVLRAAAETGRPVPQALAVVGFDDIELASYTLPQLTTIIQPKVEMGRRAVQLLTERIADKDRPPRREVLATTLVVRESSMPPGSGPAGNIQGGYANQN